MNKIIISLAIQGHLVHINIVQRSKILQVTNQFTICQSISVIVKDCIFPYGVQNFATYAFG